MRVSLGLLAIVVLTPFALAAEPKQPSHLLLAAPDALQSNVHVGASHMLWIDVGAVLDQARVDKESEAWIDLYAELDRLGDAHGGRSLHARFFFAKNVMDQVRGNFPLVCGELKTQLKRKLADVDVYIVWVDLQVQNGKKTWDDVRDQLK